MAAMNGARAGLVGGYGDDGKIVGGWFWLADGFGEPKPLPPVLKPTIEELLSQI